MDKVTARRRGRRIIIIRRRRRNGAKTISLQTLCGDLIIIRNGAKTISHQTPTEFVTLKFYERNKPKVYLSVI